MLSTLAQHEFTINPNTSKDILEELHTVDIGIFWFSVFSSVRYLYRTQYAQSTAWKIDNSLWKIAHTSLFHTPRRTTSCTVGPTCTGTGIVPEVTTARQPTTQRREQNDISPPANSLQPTDLHLEITKNTSLYWNKKQLRTGLANK